MPRTKTMEERLRKLGNILFDQRMRKDVSTAIVAEEIGVTRQYISQLEKGQKQPSPEKIRLLAEYYSYDEDELFYILGEVPLSITELVKSEIELHHIINDIYKNTNMSDERRKGLLKHIKLLIRDYND